MTEPFTPRRKENWLIYGPLWAVSAIFVIAGALAAYWIVHEYFGYHGNKSATFYIAGAVGGYFVTQPLWWLYRKRYPKVDAEPKS